MRRIARAALAALAAPLIATPAPAPPAPGIGGPASAPLIARSVPLNPQGPDQQSLGPLRYRGGWTLTSSDRRFGAISALAVEEDGSLLALSDHAILFRFAAPVAGAQRVQIHPLRQGPGGLDSKVDRDSEAFARAGDRLWLAFENSNEVWRYRAGDLAATGRSAPPAARRWPANRGAEAMLRFPDGRFLLISEDVDDVGVSQAILFLGDPGDPATRSVPLRVEPPAGHRITDAALLPDGRTLLLARAFAVSTGWTARLLLAELPPRAGGMIATREVAAFESPLTRDNLEGLAIAVEGERTILWIASDDNLNPLQRTLLLKFEWVG